MKNFSTLHPNKVAISDPLSDNEYKIVKKLLNIKVGRTSRWSFEKSYQYMFMVNDKHIGGLFAGINDIGGDSVQLTISDIYFIGGTRNIHISTHKKLVTLFLSHADSEYSGCYIINDFHTSCTPWLELLPYRKANIDVYKALHGL